MKILIFLQITSPWDWRSFWALLRGFHLGAEHRLPTTHCVPNTIPDNPCKSPTATWVLTWALKRGWTSPNRWHVPASKNLRGVMNHFVTPVQCQFIASGVKSWDSLVRSLKRVGGNFWCVRGEEGDTLTFVVLCLCRSWGFPAGNLWRDVPDSQGSGSATRWDCG